MSMTFLTRTMSGINNRILETLTAFLFKYDVYILIYTYGAPSPSF